MAENTFTTAQSVQAMDLLAQSFALFPMPNVEPPKPKEMGQFLLQYPQYVAGGKYDAVAWLMASDRRFTEVLSPERQNLASSLIAAVLSEQELREVAEIN